MIEQAKAILARNADCEIREEEAIKLLENLNALTEILLRIAKEEIRRKQLLIASPNGFHFDRKGYSCLVCNNIAWGEDSWYDKYGLKCMKCQQAVNSKIIPASIAKDKKRWYSLFELEMYFLFKPITVRKLVKNGILVQRVITNEKKSPHLTLFLLRDNKKTLPPKKLVESKIVKRLIDGQEWYCTEPWYRFANPFERLKNYRIATHLNFNI